MLIYTVKYKSLLAEDGDTLIIITDCPVVAFKTALAHLNPDPAEGWDRVVVYTVIADVEFPRETCISFPIHYNIKHSQE